MPDIKLKNGSGIEQTYTGVDTITVPLADGTGNWTFGLTDEDLTFVADNNMYLFTPNLDAIVNKYIDRIKIAPTTYNNEKLYMLSNLMNNSQVEDVSSITFDCAGVNLFNATQMCVNSHKLKKLPKVINNENTPISITTPAFTCDSLTEQEILEFIQGFTYSTNQLGKSSSASNIVGAIYDSDNILDPSELNAKWHSIINHEKSYHNYSSNPNYDGLKSTIVYAKSMRNIPIQYTDTTKRTSSFDIAPKYASIPFCDSFAFATDNGAPYSMNWKSMVLELGSSSYGFGYDISSYTYSFADKAQNFWKQENNIFTSNSMTIDEAKARYDQLKNRDDWYSCASNSVTYDGKSMRLPLLFSRYNHDSAVETINSLPDTSAYLATAGGTNTIKFKGYSGALTDGGAINTLTEEEIAVAAAKGWTISFT